MKYLFIDGWADYSIMFEGGREDPISSILLLYATLLNDNGNYVKYIDARDISFSKEKINSVIKEEHIECLCIYANSDNVHSIWLSNIWSEYINLKIILVSMNEDLSDFISSENVYNIIFNEKESWLVNANNFLCMLQAKVCVDPEKIGINYSFIDTFKNKTVLINIGSGCLGKCNYCSISNTTIEYRKIKTIMKEIDYLLSKGVKYFHVANHMFAYKEDFIIDFCNELIKRKTKYDFAWSCYIFPSFFIKKTYLLPLMADANLKKIEIGCESGCKNILKEMGITHVNRDIETIIYSAQQALIPLIGLHFIIGSPHETEDSLNSTKKIILQMMDATSSLIDIYLHCYYPENGAIEEVDFIKKRADFIQESKSLRVRRLKKETKALWQSIQQKRALDLKKTSTKTQFNYYRLAAHYGIKNQIKDELFKHNQYYFEFMLRNEYVYTSWSVKGPIEKYSPKLVGTLYLPDEKLAEDLSNMHTIILNCILMGFTVEEIVKKLYNDSHGKIEKDTVLSYLDKLEEKQQIYYVKYLQ